MNKLNIDRLRERVQFAHDKGLSFHCETYEVLQLLDKFDSYEAGFKSMAASYDAKIKAADELAKCVDKFDFCNDETIAGYDTYSGVELCRALKEWHGVKGESDG